MMADAVTDLVQGSVLVLGLVLLLVMALSSGDLSALSSVSAEHLAFTTPDESFFDIAEGWAVPLLGSLVAQELISRVCSARSPEVARNAALLAAPFYLALGLIPVAIALASTVVLPELEHPEQVLPLAAQRYFHPVLQVVFQGALVSAILSTVDSALLVAGSLVAHNLVLPLRPALDEASKLRVNRIAVLVFGLIAYGLALSADGVYALVEAASAFGSAGVFTCTLFGLYSKLGGERSALASLAVGVLAYGLGEHVLELGHPFLISVFSSVLAYLAFAPIDGAKHGQPQPSATP
jgi:Na+/proline symporter